VGSITAEAPWLRVSGHDSSRWQFFKIKQTGTSTEKWTAGPPDLVSIPSKTYSGESPSFYYVAGPEVFFVDQSLGVDSLSTEITEIGSPAQQQAAPAQAAPAGSGKPLELSQGERDHFDATLKTGRPSQMYLLALDMEQSGHPELATRLLKAIVDRFPDDPYAAKAIDRLEVKRGSKR
jgi:TolA-binding protein